MTLSVGIPPNDRPISSYTLTFNGVGLWWRLKFCWACLLGDKVTVSDPGFVPDE